MLVSFIGPDTRDLALSPLHVRTQTEGGISGGTVLTRLTMLVPWLQTLSSRTLRTFLVLQPPKPPKMLVRVLVGGDGHVALMQVLTGLEMNWYQNSGRRFAVKIHILKFLIACN